MQKESEGPPNESLPIPISEARQCLLRYFWLLRKMQDSNQHE